jgi:hypothetical protein
MSGCLSYKASAIAWLSVHFMAMSFSKIESIITLVRHGLSRFKTTLNKIADKKTRTTKQVMRVEEERNFGDMRLVY